MGMAIINGVPVSSSALSWTQFPHHTIVQNITHLEIYDPACLQAFKSKLQHFASLRSLSVSLETCNGYLPIPGQWSRISFPLVEELQIFVQSDMAGDCKVFEELLDSWVFPKLCRLVIQQSKFNTQCLPAYHKALRKYGVVLQALSLAITRMGTGQPPPSLTTTDIQALLKYCPELEHLSLAPIIIQGPLFHDKLQYVDIWETSNDLFPDARAIRGLFSPQQFPSLKSVRFVDWALLSTCGSRLPMLISHNVMGGRAQLEWLYDGIHVQHVPGHLYSRDMDYVDSYYARYADDLSLIPSIGMKFLTAPRTEKDSKAESEDDDEDDSTFRSVSPSYTAYDSEEGDLETLETPYDESFQPHFPDLCRYW